MAAAKRSTLLSFCRSLPGATEDIKWGADLVFSVGDKMFACFYKDGKDATFSCKVPEDEFTAITSIDGIRPAPYAARYHWVSVDDPKVLPEKEAISFIRQSYDLVKSGLSKKKQAAIDGGGAKKKVTSPSRARGRARS